jgi:hypothetical protein
VLLWTATEVRKRVLAAKGRAVMGRAMRPSSIASKVLHALWSISVHLLVVDMRLRLILWRKAIGTDLERACLPCKAIEAVNRACSVFTAAHEHVAVAATAVVGAKTDISAQHRASLAEQVFEILPSNTIRELNVSDCEHCCMLTFPTNRFTRPSDPIADGRMLVMRGVKERVEVAGWSAYCSPTAHRVSW